MKGLAYLSVLFLVAHTAAASAIEEDSTPGDDAGNSRRERREIKVPALLASQECGHR